MQKLKSKFVIGLLIFCISIPAANAFGFLAPVLFPAISFESALALSAAAHAAVIAFLKFSDPDKPTDKPIVIQLDPNKPLVTPEGWVSPTQPPAAKEATPSKTQYYWNGAASSAADTACEANHKYFPQNSGQYITPCTNLVDFGYQTIYGNGPYACKPAPNGTDWNCWRTDVGQTPETCPDGYTYTLNATPKCQLSNAALVKKPPQNYDMLIRTTTGFKRDPQQATEDKNSRVYVTDNYISYTNDAGEKVTVNLPEGPYGTAEVTQAQPDYSTNKTQKITVYVTAPTTSASTSISAVAQSTTSGIDTNAPTPGTGTGTGSGNINCPNCATEATLSNIKALLEQTPSGDASATGSAISSNLDAGQQETADTNKTAIQNWIANSTIPALYADKIAPLSPFNQLTEGTSADCAWHVGMLWGSDVTLSICEAQPALHTALSFIFFILMVIGVLNVLTERPDAA